MSEGRFVTRREDVTIPCEIMPIYGISRDEKEKKECLFVYERDDTLVCRYPLDKVLMYRHPEYFKGGNNHETSWGLGVLISQYQRSKEPEFLPIHKVAIHPYNVRYIPPSRTNSIQLSKLIAMAKSRDLAIPMIVVPVDRNLIRILLSIAEKAKKLGLDPEEVLSGIIWRKVKYESLSKDHRLVAREDDEVYSALVSKFGRVDPEIEYLIVDGFLRYYASYRAFVDEPDAWNRIPEVYARVLQEGMDVLSAAYISRRINSYEREIDADSVAVSAFANLFDLGEVVMKLGERSGIRGLEEAGKGWGPSGPQAVGAVKSDVEDFKFRMASLEAGEEEAVAEGKPKEEEREERRWERKEEPTRHADVSEVQRQFAPTSSYAPAQPQPSAQMPVSPPARPVREEAQPQPVRLDEISVLSAVLNGYLAKQNTQAHLYVFHGKGIDVRLDYNLKKALEGSGLTGRGLEIDIRYTNISDLPVKGTPLRARVYVPVAWDKYCPKCGHLIVLSPTRCVFCGEVLSPLPCVVSYRPKT